MSKEIDIPIVDFRETHEFLSNFYSFHFEWRGHTWLTSEHAYQAAKTVTLEEFEYVKNAQSPGEAKRRGRKIECREDWEEIEVDVMLDILRTKFAPSSWLAQQLLNTGDSELVEGNNWHDCFWGVCHCSKCKGKGRNMLGKSLMKIRAELREK